MIKIKILIVDDEKVIRDGLSAILQKAGFEALCAADGETAMSILQQQSVDLVLSDLKMPQMSGLDVLRAIKLIRPHIPVVIITGYARIETAVETMQQGASDYLPKPFSPAEVLEKIDAVLADHPAPPLVSDKTLPEEIPGLVGNSLAMQKVSKRILQVAPTDSTILITGESGTGKELVARAIHQQSQRKERPFVAVDCTALAESLLESELFGHKRGSFTGADADKTGLFQMADGGTLFLDEIANLSLTTQAKLLRALQQREVTPLGSGLPIPVDIRLVAATNRSLGDLVKEKTFRADLYFRLNTIPVNLPPLRERAGDLHLLLDHLFKKHTKRFSKGIKGLTRGALNLLQEHTFPGNVRELENLIERAVVLCQGEYIGTLDLEICDGRDAGIHDSIPRTADELKEIKQRLREEAVLPVERAFVLAALEENDWNVTRAAEQVGMQRPNFQALLKKQGISARDHSMV